MIQKEYFGFGSISNLEKILINNKIKRIFLITGRKSYVSCGAEKVLNNLLKGYFVKRFFDFSSNPRSEDVAKGINIFKKGDYEIIIAIGGGSVIDMAKLIRVLSVQEKDFLDYINGKPLDKKGINLVAIPTTSGSGSEITHFAVVYINGMKYSLSDKKIIPEYSIVDPRFTMNLPPKITAVTGMDAFSQAVESYWCVNSTDESKEYSARAIKLILSNLTYAVNYPSQSSRKAMAEAAHLSGKAINITKTTAPHALSYTFTSKFGIPHGHAVALTLGQILKYNTEVTKKDCNDKRGTDYVKDMFTELCSIMGCANIDEAKDKIQRLLTTTGLECNLKELGLGEKEVEEIADNVNYERLKNNPRKLSKKDILDLLN
jgi:alcohol dehydrogenase